ncbi:DNA-deoxyinosine glycosylase [Rugamonas sp. CCM 8940]|uniref:DNA-deoxyinosine glycosylase n=1 Tax=Rugamonas sp. CCM 8940 TaxID=2765359 RepID=UPI0018F369F8|nr:DNA-deoxyinosine glycosylase [Rugamonas sp. CCM 8940]MBJ7313977.1 DNA-deoxyinosine glycosylase [Rugamonas sp. CCM 8940]
MATPPASAATAAPGPVLRKRCFDPVVDQRTRLLVLGSLPGDQSLLRNEYYGNKQNKFWELLGVVIDVDLRSLNYDARLAALLEHGIGLWDVIAEAERAGSLDSAIYNASHNALAELVATLPSLRAIGFNGGTAARLGRKQLQATATRLSLIDLPSSSPAYTIGFEPKLQVWRQLSNYLPLS